MPLIEFKYSCFRDKKIPLIPLEVKGKDGWLEIWAFVDSGASFSVFDKDEALNLGLLSKMDRIDGGGWRRKLYSNLPSPASDKDR